jgi:putative hydrolase of the HAD superfamily
VSHPQITTLLCDIGGVLLTNGWDRAARRLAAAQFRLDPADLDERHHFVFDTYEEGKSTLDEYLSHVVFYEPRPFTREEFKAFMFAQSKRLPGMIEFLQQVRARHRLKIFALSNEGRELTLYRVKTFRLTELMDAFVCSCFVHVRKPDADIFRIALDIAQAAPEQAVYLDDRAMFAQIGGEQGLRAIHHTGIDATRDRLASLGIGVP